jgi:hypothetical protein
MLSNTMKLLRIFFSIALLLLVSVHSFAGWLITGKNIDTEEKTIPVRIFIEKTNVKIEQPEYIAQFDMRTRRIILVDPVKLTYYQGNLLEYQDGVKLFKKNALKIATSDMTVEQANKYKQPYLDQIERSFEIPKVEPGTITLKKTDIVFKMVGWQTDKYEISMNGLLIEQVWIAPGMKAGEGFDWSLYFNFLKAAGLEDESINYMNSQEYLELLNIGFPLRKIVNIGGVHKEFQVNRLEEKTITDYEFYTPSLCKELTITEWLQQRVADENINDDYE